MTKVPDGGVPAEPFKTDADLFLGSEIAANDAFYIWYEFPGLLCPGFSLPDTIGYSLTIYT